jgi:hypothetical protein
MSYRRVRSYRRRDARRYRDVPERPRARRVPMIGLLTVALVAGIATLSAPHIKAMLTVASSTEGLAGNCAAPAAAGLAGPARSDAAAGVPMAVADSRVLSAPATPVPTSEGGSAAAAPTATASVVPTSTAPGMTSTSASTPSATNSSGRPAPAASANSSSAAPAPTASAGTTPCPSATAATPPAANTNCEIVVPAHPLTAAGLATPYRLTGPGGATPAASGCTMANEANLGAFVQATILDQATGKLWVYEPLVITKGTKPAATPVMPILPARAVVTIDVGFNGDNLTLVGATSHALHQGHCHNGLGNSIFGQVSFCHGTHFFWAARRAERQGKLVVPPAGVSPKTGQACPTTRSFTIVDQDPSDNVTTKYLLTASGRTAQFSKTNAAAMPGATVISNGSDNALLDVFVDPVLGCNPFTAPDLSQGGAPGTSQALDELSAGRSQAAPVALVPENDPMVLVGNAFSAAKTDRYRVNVGQPAISSKNDTADSPANFCRNMINIQARFLNDNEELLASGPSPVPSVGNNLLTFMANRLIMSYGNLSCQDFALSDPVKVSLNGNGTATAATFDTTQQTAKAQVRP